jgi:hypothetical protein
MNFWHNVLSIHENHGLFRRAQRYVQYRPALCDVDFVTPEHGGDPLPQSGFGRQLKEQLQRFLGDAVFRIVQVKSRRFQRHPLATF